MKPLQHITILDFTRLLPGPVATHLLGQMGASIIKIESPKRRDYVRDMGVKMVDGASVLFHQINHNKTSRILDYTTEEGREQVLEWVKEADVLIEQFRPGAMAAWGLDYETLKKVNPALVYVSLTGYGQEGALAAEAGHDVNYLAYTGLLSLLKDEQGKPTVPDTQLADIGGSYMAIIALQAALLQRMQTGKGSWVDVNLSDAVHPLLTIPYSFHSSGVDYRQFNVINGKTAVNYSTYVCADGRWLALGALEMKFWNNLCDLIEKQEWKKSNQLELMNFVFPKAELIAIFKSKTQAEWVELCKGKDVCIAPILELEELEEHPYHQERGTFETFETDKGTKLTTIALPFKLKE